RLERRVSPPGGREPGGGGVVGGKKDPRGFPGRGPAPPRDPRGGGGRRLLRRGARPAPPRPAANTAAGARAAAGPVGLGRGDSEVVPELVQVLPALLLEAIEEVVGMGAHGGRGRPRSRSRGSPTLANRPPGLGAAIATKRQRTQAGPGRASVAGASRAVRA